MVLMTVMTGTVVAIAVVAIIITALKTISNYFTYLLFIVTTDISRLYLLK